ncbi:hypothetical protein GCM10023085_18110 [Actinomadura viridis]|uniref:DUF917 family protein n=1 Tax=Actinomadura viridis TaxID=58110 RepID=A0A931GJQ1_9ACTN|nr:DUF917 family protein [Actinomadura viridis]MBG6089432.1 DUF917 family protein [Actinomadura viridis]
MEGLGADSGRLLRLQARSEYLIAHEDGRRRAAVPDIIAVLDSRGAAAIPVERLRYGLRVSVLTLPCAPVWNTPAGRRLCGPRVFGLGEPE